MRKTSLILGGMLAATLSLPVAAGDHTTVKAEPWTPASLMQALQAMPKGDAVRGQKVHEAQFCASCHGVKGEATTANWPTLVGQRAEYTYKMLLDYKTHRRAEDERGQIMTHVAQLLSEQDMADLAAFYAGQALPTMHGGKDNAVAEKLVRQGDPARLITPCAACHGLQGQGGVNETPALAGQTVEYFERTMKLYRDGQRHNDSMQAMRAFAKPLTDAEIAALARYYASPSAP